MLLRKNRLLARAARKTTMVTEPRLLRSGSLLLFLLPVWCHAETVTLTMKQAVAIALQQNPDIALARIDEQKAALNVRLMKDPFRPKVTAGSGAAYTNGYPLSVEGSGPSVVQAVASQFLLNKRQSYLIKEASENARGAELSTGSKSDEVAYRVVSLYLDADKARRLSDAAAREVEELVKISKAVAARVDEGKELPVENTRANVNILKARQRLSSLNDDQDSAEQQLAVALGRSPADRVRASDAERPAPATPTNEAAALEVAIGSNKDIRKLDSAMAAKGLDIKADHASHYPRVDLLAQYALFASYNHYEQYFRQFQPNNGEIGVSIQIPLMLGPGVKAQMAIAEEDIAHMRIEKNQLQSRIAVDLHRAYQNVQKAKTAREVAQADLQLAREQLSIVLAQAGEGRVAMRQVEEAHFAEDEKWITFYDADAAVERAQYEVLRQTGEIIAALR
jgi:outer membrane protein TolC